MPLTITLPTITAKQINIQTAGRTAGYDRVEVQISTRPDFQFVPSVVLPALPDAGGLIGLAGFAPSNRYWIRARELRLSDSARLAWTATIAAYTLAGTAWDTAPLSIMVRPGIIVVPEEVTWAVTTPQAGRPASNLSSDAPAEQMWMTLPGTINMDTSGVPIDTIALLFTNAPPGLRVAVRSYATAANRTANTSIQSEIADMQFHASPGLPGRPYYNFLARLPVARTERFWRLDFGDSADPGFGYPPGNLLVAGFGVMGLARTAKNIAADKVETPLDYGSLERTRDGTPDRRAGHRGRRVEFEIALMTEAQWETQFADLRHKIGLTESVLVVPNTRAGAFLHDRILYGPLATNRSSQPFTPRFTQGLTVESLI